MLWIICGDYTNPVPVKFDSSPATVVSVGYDHFNRTRWYSLGAELFQMERSYTAESLVGIRGQWEVTNLLFTSKFYMNRNGAFQPYVGVGIGTAQSKLSGAISGSSRGTIWKTMLGINYRRENIAFRAGYQYNEIGLTTTSASGNDGLEREIHAESFLDFDGYFVSLGIQF